MGGFLVRVARALGPLVIVGSAGLGSLDAQQIPDRQRLPFVRDAFLLRGGTLIDGRGGPPQENATILIYNGRIQALGPQEMMLVPEGTQVVELAGKYILPGFVDARAVPLDTAANRALLYNGITAVLSSGPTIRSGGTSPADLGGPGPRVFAAGPALDGPQRPLHGATVVRDEEETREAVRRQKETGSDFVQLYRALPASLVQVAVDEAHERDLSVIGDLETTSWIEAARYGIDVLRPIVSRNPDLLPEAERGAYESERASGEGFQVLAWLESVEPGGEEFDDALGALLGTDVTVEPSLVSIESTLFCGHPDYPVPANDRVWWVDEETAGTGSAECIGEERFLSRANEAWPTAFRLTSMLHDEGVRLLAGSNSPVTRLPPGVAFQRELELLVQAGIPPLDVLSIATRNGAIALGKLHEMGTVEVGKRADLVLLGSNPLEDIRATRDVLWVILEGDVFVVADQEAG